METHLEEREKEKKGNAAGFHLRADAGDEVFWMQLAVPATLSLAELDRFLRDTWLECCGHMSAFTIDGLCYNVPGGGGIPGERSMKNTAMGDVLRPGLEFSHEYDFGTTTELRLRVVSEGAYASRKGVEILARNAMPDFRCETCGAPCVTVCTACMQGDDDAWFCEACAKEHRENGDCGDEYFLPVVNSPRVGQCGYTGS